VAGTALPCGRRVRCSFWAMLAGLSAVCGPGRGGWRELWPKTQGAVGVWASPFGVGKGCFT